MKNRFENLGIWEFVNVEEERTNGAKSHKLENIVEQEHMELAQFGRVLHDWRPMDKKKNIKQDNKR